MAKCIVKVLVVCVAVLGRGATGEKIPIDGYQGPLPASNEVAGGNNNNIEVANLIPSASDSHYRAAAYYYLPATGPSGNVVYQHQGKTGIPTNWNRDSYTEAATDYGYGTNGHNNNQQAHPQPYGVHHQGNSHDSSAFASNNAHGDDGDFDSEGLLGGGLAGLLGIKGLKGLGLVGLLKGVVGFPFFGLPLLLLFFGLPLLLLAPLLLFFLPFPVITIPTAPGRSLSVDRTFGLLRFADFSNRMTNLARSVLESEKCVERVSCEISRVSRGSVFDQAITRMIFQYETRMPSPIRRMARAYIATTDSCSKYSCGFVADLKAKKL